MIISLTIIENKIWNMYFGLDSNHQRAWEDFATTENNEKRKKFSSLSFHEIEFEFHCLISLPLIIKNSIIRSTLSKALKVDGIDNKNLSRNLCCYLIPLFNKPLMSSRTASITPYKNSSLHLLHTNTYMCRKWAIILSLYSFFEKTNYLNILNNIFFNNVILSLIASQDFEYMNFLKINYLYLLRVWIW